MNKSVLTCEYRNKSVFLLQYYLVNRILGQDEAHKNQRMVKHEHFGLT